MQQTMSELKRNRREVPAEKHATRQQDSFSQKVKQVEALLPSFVGSREERRDFDRGIGYIRHSATDFAKFVIGVTRLLRLRGDADELAAFTADPLRSGLDYIYADCHKPDDKLMSGLFARLACLEAYRNSRGVTEIREWSGPWCMNPSQNSSRVVFPLENLSNRPKELPVTFAGNEDRGGIETYGYGPPEHYGAVRYWERDQGRGFLKRVAQCRGAEVFISRSHLELGGGRSVGQGKLSFKDRSGVNVFEFNGGALTAQKVEGYIQRAGGIPVYGSIQIVPDEGTTQTWYGTIGVDATRREVESWLKFVKSVGPEKCKITMVQEAGRAGAPLFLAEGNGETYGLQLTSNSGVNRILGNLALYSYKVVTLNKGEEIKIPSSRAPETFFPCRDRAELYPQGVNMLS
jgi:hypothetical protein